MNEKKLTPEEIREMLTQPIDIEELLNHEFEYYIWFRGHSHRLAANIGANQSSKVLYPRRRRSPPSRTSLSPSSLSLFDLRRAAWVQVLGLPATGGVLQGTID